MGRKSLNVCKIAHPNSRKAKQLIRQNCKSSSREKKQLAHFMKLNSCAERILWFRDHSKPGIAKYTPELIHELIKQYLRRFDEELDTIKTSQKIYNRRKYASREDQLKHIIEEEVKEYEGCGLEVPDMLNCNCLENLRCWNGELRFLQNIQTTRYSQKQLQILN